MDEFTEYPTEQDYRDLDLMRDDADGWDLTDEEARENADYISELRFGGDARSDREIREAVFESMREDYDYDDYPHDREGY